MLTPGWSVVLTVIFVLTGLYALVRWARWVARPRSLRRAEVDEPHGPNAGPVELNHVIMSAAMVVMVWWPAGTVGTIVQIVIFAAFGLLFLDAVVRGGGVGRVAGVAHLIMNAAMVWMLAAMPLLMGGMTGSGADAHAGHHHGGGDDPAMPMAPTTTPGWAAVINWVAVVIMVAVAVWWLVRTIRSDHDRVHLCCHGVMGAGMALMLVAMR